MSGKPEIFIALESLPAVLTRRDCLLILEALNARQFFTPSDWAGAKMGDVLATLIHRRADDQRRAERTRPELWEDLF